MKGDEIDQTIQNARNHTQRAREGLALLQQGKPPILSLEPVGFEPADFNSRRESAMAALRLRSPGSLRLELAKLEQHILERESTDIVGTSELNWRRNAIKILLGDL